MGDSKDKRFGPQPLWFLPIWICSTFVVATLYHCIICCCKRHHAPQSPPSPGLQPSIGAETSEAPRSIAISMAQIIPAHKYHKGMGSIGEDGMCAVCLSEFEEGEELRKLPECLHSYHAPCIDMWLLSHPNCPLCRTTTVAP